MRRAVECVAFWGFQLAFGGLFAAVFVFVVPQAVEGWVLQGLSIALGGFVGLAVGVGLAVTAWAWWTGPTVPDELGVCPCCGQSLPLAQPPDAEPRAAANGGGTTAFRDK